MQQLWISTGSGSPPGGHKQRRPIETRQASGAHWGAGQREDGCCSDVVRETRRMTPGDAAIAKLAEYVRSLETRLDEFEKLLSPSAGERSDPSAPLPAQERAVCKPSLSDVVRAYRIFLGRNVENVDVAVQHLATADDLWDLVERIWASPEAARRRIGEAVAAIGAMDDWREISVDASADQLAEIIAQVEADWSRRGFGSHHNWLLRHEPRYDERSAKWNVARAFEAGGKEADALRGWMAQAGVTFGEGSVAVFGENAFRLAGAVNAGPYLGIDPRPSGVSVGTNALAERDLRHAQLIPVSAFRDGAHEYDLFYSVMALQYAPPPMSRALLDRALDQVRPGGLAYFQLAGHLYGYSFAADAYLAGQGRDSHGEIHVLPQPHVLDLLDRRGFTVIDLRPDGRLGSLGVSYSFLARRYA
jgi:hypothetical protein